MLPEPAISPPALAARIAAEMGEIERARQVGDGITRRGAEVEVGELLIAVRERARHGEWLPWLAANFPGDARTARKYMNLARNGARPKWRIPSELELRLWRSRDQLPVPTEDEHLAEGILYDEGTASSQCAQMHGCSQKFVRKTRLRNGREPEYGEPQDDERVTALVRLNDGGESVRKIADVIGISKSQTADVLNGKQRLSLGASVPQYVMDVLRVR